MSRQVSWGDPRLFPAEDPPVAGERFGVRVDGGRFGPVVASLALATARAHGAAIDGRTAVIVSSDGTVARVTRDADGFVVTPWGPASRPLRCQRLLAGRVALLGLSKSVQDELHPGAMSVSDGVALLAFQDQPEVIERLLADEWSRRDIERAVIREQHRVEAAKANDARRAAAHHTAERSDDDEDASSTGRSVQRPDPMVEERAEAKARATAHKTRVEFARGLIGRKLPKTDVSSLVGSQVLGDLCAAHAKVACRILGVDPIVGRFGPDHRAALTAHAVMSTADRDRALLAAALAIGEEHARHSTTTTRRSTTSRSLPPMATNRRSATPTPVDTYVSRPINPHCHIPHVEYE